LKAMVPPSLRDDYRDPSAFSSVAAMFLDYQRQGAGYYAASVKKIHEAGIPVITGTDSGNLGVFHGYSLHRELRLLVDAGLGTWDALRAATVHPARFLGVESGFAPGSVAHLVVLDGN